jgi:hypothetical protein
MKKQYLLPVLFLFVLSSFYGCKKTTIDPREKFLGKYTGTISVSIPTLIPTPLTQAYEPTITKSTTNPNEILIDGNAATVVGNTYIYDEFTETGDVPQLGTAVATFNGSGVLNGNSLSESGTVKVIIQGMTYNGTWTSTAVKQ